MIQLKTIRQSPDKNLPATYFSINIMPDGTFVNSVMWDNLAV
jgi:hypothetical protein